MDQASFRAEKQKLVSNDVEFLDDGFGHFHCEDWGVKYTVLEYDTSVELILSLPDSGMSLSLSFPVSKSVSA
jgi:hypothetical protein